LHAVELLVDEEVGVVVVAHPSWVKAVGGLVNTGRGLAKQHVSVGCGLGLLTRSPFVHGSCTLLTIDNKSFEITRLAAQQFGNWYVVFRQMAH